MNIQEVREKFPQYNDLSDEQLAQGLHKKFYSDMPYEQFSQKIGLAKKEPQKVEATLEGIAGEAGKGIVRGMSDTAIAAGRGGLSAILGPIGGALAGKGIEYLAAPSREPFAATPENTAEKVAGVVGEFGGGFIAPGLPSMVQSGAQALGKIPHLPVISEAVKGTGRFVDRLLPGGAERSVGRTLLTLAGDKQTPVIKALGEAKEIVRGSSPTAAQAAAKAGSAEFSGAQRIAEQRLPTEYLDIATSGEKARQGLIQSFGGTPGKLQKAVADRAKEAKGLYEEAAKQVLIVDDELKALLNTDSMKQAMKRVASIETEVGKARPAPEGAISVGKLHYLKMAIDDFVNSPDQFGIAGLEKAAYQGTREALIKWITSRSPLYEKARNAFAKASGEINVMQVGQQLEKGLTAPLAGAERPTPFATAMREAPRTIERATGSPRFTTLEQAVGKDNAAAAQSVLDDLSRIAQHEKLEKAGAGRAKEIVGQSFPSLPATGPLNQVYMIFKTIFNRFGGSLTEKEILVLSKALKTPEETLRIMNNAAKREALMLNMINPQFASQQMTLGQKLYAGTAGGGAALGENEQ